MNCTVPGGCAAQSTVAVNSTPKGTPSRKYRKPAYFEVTLVTRGAELGFEAGKRVTTLEGEFPGTTDIGTLAVVYPGLLTFKV